MSGQNLKILAHHYYKTSGASVFQLINFELGSEDFFY